MLGPFSAEVAIRYSSIGVAGCDADAMIERLSGRTGADGEKAPTIARIIHFPERQRRKAQ